MAQHLAIDGTPRAVLGSHDGERPRTSLRPVVYSSLIALMLIGAVLLMGGW